MKKLISLLLAGSMLFSLALPVFAEGAVTMKPDETEGTVLNVLAEEKADEAELSDDETAESRDVAVPLSEDGVVASGTCGTNLTWVLDDTGTLTISGSGKMEDYTWTDAAPWYSNREAIQEIVFQGSITSVGARAFYSCNGLTTVTIPMVIISIGEWAFAECHNVEEVTLSNSVTSLGMYVFANCKSLTNITMSESVISIGSDAFYGCENLGEIAIPKSVTSIGVGAFSGCSSLTEVTIPEGVTSIGTGVFVFCVGLTGIYVDDNNSAYCDQNGVLFNKAGTQIMCFPAAKTEERYDIPESVTSIAEGAFSACSSLTAITIPVGVTNIGEWVFFGCNNLKEITIPEGVTNIESEAFYTCSRLTEIVLPASVTSIGYRAFNGCGSLTDVYYSGTEAQWNAISIEEYNTELTSATIHYSESPLPGNIVASGTCGAEGDGSNLTWVLDDTGTLTISGTGEMEDYLYPDTTLWHFYQEEIVNVIIKDGATNIGAHAFEFCSGLKNVTIPQSLTSIGSYAFYECGSLDDIRIPEAVTSIGDFAFSGCGQLKEIIVPENVVDMGSYVFYGCNNLLTAGPIGSGCDYEFGWKTSIPDNAFSFCVSMISVTLPEGMSTVGESAFSGCRALKKITIPKSVMNIGKYAFSQCENILTAGPIGSGCDYEFGWQDKIPENAFAYCMSLNKITVPESIISIGDSAFWQCTSLLTAGPIGSNCDYEFGWQNSIPDNAFEFCESLTSVILPENIVSIGSSAFWRCVSLKSITIPESVTSIGLYAFGGCDSLLTAGPIESGCDYEFGWQDCIPANAFGGCSNLTNVAIPEEITYIGQNAFSNCSSLEKVLLPDKVTRINGFAFGNCSGLKEIMIPVSLTSVYEAAFDGCSSLTDVYYGGNEEQWNAISIMEDNGELTSATIHYNESTLPSNIVASGVCGAEDDGSNLTWMLDNAGTMTISGSGAMEDYSSFDDTPWAAEQDLISEVVLDADVTYIGEYAFYNCTNLERVKSVDALDENNSLPGITLSAEKVGIGDYAFAGCTNLKEIILPAGMTSIGANAFAGCTSLEEIVLPEGVVNIGEEAFFDCIGLKKITIPASVTEIGANAFEGCNSLTSVLYAGNEEEWKSISKDGNVVLDSVEIQYNAGSTGGDKTDSDTPSTPSQGTGSSGSGGGCYVATAVYGSYDCPEVWTLRRYRDYELSQTAAGRAFIYTYYAVSPTIVEYFGDEDWFQAMWRGPLDRMVTGLQARGYESTPYEDIAW